MLSSNLNFLIRPFKNQFKGHEFICQKETATLGKFKFKVHHNK